MKKIDDIEAQMDKLREVMEKLKSAAQSGELDSQNQETDAPGETWDGLGTNLAEGTYVKVSDDKMSAWMYLMPPDKEQSYTKRELLTFLEKSGVVRGYHSSNLSAMIKKKVYEREILVARGCNTEDGEDGHFEYLFSPEEYGVPKIRKDGSVDYSNISALQNVRKGEKIAIYHYAKPGVDGFNVCGQEVKAKSGRDLPPMRGRGISRENNEYFAEMDGKIEVKNGKIDIQNVHEIYEDVDTIIGRVEFFGDVIINGNVESGVVIRAGRNIEIHGTTAAATLYAGGDVILTRGIQGGGKISARGNVFADFIENTTVEAGGTVQSNTILNAQVYAKDKVITTGRKGAIIGGYVHGLKGIEAMCAGNDAEIKTTLHCGYEPESYDRLIEVKHIEQETKIKLAELVDTMTEALREKRLRGSSTARETEMKLLEWDKQKDAYFETLDKASRERETLEELMEMSKGATIRIDGKLYRNVVISINTEKMKVNQNTCYMKYTDVAGIIEGSVVIHN